MNSQTNTKQTKALQSKKTLESVENISAMKRNQNIYDDVSGSLEKVASAVHASREYYPRKNWVQCLKVFLRGITLQDLCE